MPNFFSEPHKGKSNAPVLTASQYGGTYGCYRNISTKEEEFRCWQGTMALAAFTY